MIDYYKVLGVPRNATQELIKKTYSAKIKMYHPDVYLGDKDFAKQMVQEINEAYNILSSSEKKKKHDEDLNKANKSENKQSNEKERFDEKAKETYDTIIEKDWKLACEYFPKIAKIAEKLGKLSSDLQLLFKICLMEDKAYDTYEDVAEQLETLYLKVKFGSKTSIQKLGRKAILSDFNSFANELENTLRVLGENQYHQILKKLALKHLEFADTHYANFGFREIVEEIALNDPNLNLRTTRKKIKTDVTSRLILIGGIIFLIVLLPAMVQCSS